MEVTCSSHVGTTRGLVMYVTANLVTLLAIQGGTCRVNEGSNRSLFPVTGILAQLVELWTENPGS